MPVIVVTRLRLKDQALQDDFFAAAVASLEQAKKAAAHQTRDFPPPVEPAPTGA